MGAPAPCRVAPARAGPRRLTPYRSWGWRGAAGGLPAEQQGAPPPRVKDSAGLLWTPASFLSDTLQGPARGSRDTQTQPGERHPMAWGWEEANGGRSCHHTCEVGWGLMSHFGKGWVPQPGSDSGTREGSAVGPLHACPPPPASSGLGLLPSLCHLPASRSSRPAASTAPISGLCSPGCSGPHPVSRRPCSSFLTRRSLMP